MLGKRDSKPTLLQKDIDQIKKVLKQMKYTSKSTISIVSQFYRLCNKKQSTTITVIYMAENRKTMKVPM